VRLALTRIITWLRRAWREATLPPEEVAQDEPPIWLRFSSPATFAELYEARRALLDAYQPKLVRGPDSETEGGK